MVRSSGVGPRGLLDGPLDVVLRHALRAGRPDGEPQTRVHVGIGHAAPGRRRDLARQLGKQLGAGRVLPALAVHDVLELRMAGHAGVLNQEVAIRQAYRGLFWPNPERAEKQISRSWALGTARVGGSTIAINLSLTIPA
jgi:hypothetical protein